VKENVFFSFFVRQKGREGVWCLVIEKLMKKALTKTLAPDVGQITDVAVVVVAVVCCYISIA
jgi:hypothetical protein